MSFQWLGTFRQGSWQAYRRFILEERRDVGERMAVIEAELTRIGEITVYYGSTVDDEGETVITEERENVSVPSDSSLGKLLQAYMALGGNPFDISLFLDPDSTVIVDDTDPEQAGQETQPHGGVVYPKSGSYVPGERYDGGFLQIKKYVPARVGGRKSLGDTNVASKIDMGRRWVRQEIQTKRNDLEARIIKLMDLREQLLEEQEALTLAVAGVSPEIPDLDENRYDKQLSVAHIVEAIDSVFYEMDETNTPDFTTENADQLANYPFLLSDDPEEENTAL